MKKSIIFMLAAILMLTIACNEDQPTKVNIVTYDKHTVLDDSNWVKVTDIDTVKTCFALGIFEGGLLLREKDTIQELISKSKAFLKNHGFEYKNYDSIVNASKIIEFDFVKKDIIVYFMELNGSARWKRKIYKNENLKAYLYLLETQRLNSSLNHLNRIYYFDEISITRLPDDYQLKIDTICKYVDKYE